MGILVGPVNNARNRKCGHRYHLRPRYVRARCVREIEKSEACMKYKDGCGRRGTLSDTREGENAEGNEEQHGQQGHRDGYRADFRAQIGTRRRRGNGGRRDRIQECRSRANESQHFPRKLQEVDIVARANG